MDIHIERHVLNEAEFEHLLSPKQHLPLRKRLATSMVPPEPVLSAIKPPMSRQAWLRFLLTHLPILHWIWTYQLQYLISDIISGVTVAFMHIPQGLAYALLADLDPVYGLYAAFIPVIVYSIFGTSRHLSIGTFAVVSLMVSNGITTVLTEQGLDYCLDIGNSSSIVSDTNMTCGDLKAQVAFSLTFLSGVIMVLFGCCGFGFISMFLSEPLISGYTTGSALLVLTSQVSHIFGIKIKAKAVFTLFPDVFKLPLMWKDVFHQIFNWPDYVNTAAFVTSLITIIAMIVFKVINNQLTSKVHCRCFNFLWRDKRCHQTKRFKWTIPLPAPLILMVIGILISLAADLENKFAVPVVGRIQPGLPPVSLPNSRYFLILLPNAFVISVVSFAVSVSLSKVLAKKYQYMVNANQEFIAYGLSNIAGSFFSSINVSGSLSRSLVQANAGGKTQLVGLLSSGILAVIMVALGGLFRTLPLAVLASIIWVELYGMFKQFADLYRYFKLSLPDMLVWLTVFIATVLLGVDLSLVIGICFSFIILVMKTALPYSAILGNAEGTELFRNIKNFDNLEKIPGILIFRFLAPLCFLSSPAFRRRLELAAQMDKKHWNKEEGGCLKTLFVKLSDLYSKRYSKLSDNQQNEMPTVDSRHVTNDVDQDDTRRDLHTVIVDCAPIGFMDAVGVRTLIQVVMDFSQLHVQVLLAATTKETRDMLERAGFYELCGKEWLFPSIQDAVNHALTGERLFPDVQNNQELLTLSTESGPQPREEEVFHMQKLSQDEVNTQPDLEPSVQTTSV
eukprot:Em0014g606a